MIQESPIGQPFKKNLEEDIQKDAVPPSDLPNIKTYKLTFSIIDSAHVGIDYTYLTRRFPFRSSRGNEYSLIAYHYDANDILAESIKNRQAKTITQVWTKINNKFASAGIHPYTYIMENEASNHLKAALIKKDIAHQLVPAHCHRSNLSEQAIHTFKNQLKAGLATKYS